MDTVPVADGPASLIGYYQYGSSARFDDRQWWGRCAAPAPHPWAPGAAAGAQPPIRVSIKNMACGWVAKPGIAA